MDADNGIGPGFDDPADVGGEQRCLADLLCSDGAADSLLAGLVR